MKVQKFKCPNCGRLIVSTYHVKEHCDYESAGVVVKIGGEWKCEKCGETCDGNIYCSCGEKFPDSYAEVIEMDL